MSPCEDCGGGLPGDVPDDKVCQCGSKWRPRYAGLKRGAPMKRGSALNRTGGLKAGTPLKRAAALPRKRAVPRAKAAPAKRSKADAIPAKVRAAVLARAAGCCEACGTALGDGPVHMHHRQKRNARNHTVENLVALHPTCHVVAPEAVHQRPAWAKGRGLILLAHHDPAAEPLVMPDGRRVLLGETYLLAA